MAEHWLVWTKSCVQYKVIKRAADLQMVQDEQQATSAESAFVTGLQQTRKMPAAIYLLGSKLTQ